MDTVFPFGLPGPTAFYLTLYLLTLVVHVIFMNYVVVPEKALILLPAWRSRAVRGAAVGSDLAPGYQTARSSGM